MDQVCIETREGTFLALYCGDCLSGLRKYLKDKSIDVVVTSPPYNIGIPYLRYRDKKPRQEYLTWIEDISKEIRRILQDDGSFFLNVGGKPSDPWIPFDILFQLRPHFYLQNVIHWVKSIAIERENQPPVTFGHYKPISGTRFLNDCQEYVFHFTKTGKVKLDRLAIGVPYQDKSNIGRWKAAKRDQRCRGNNWYIPYETIQRRDRDRPHPSPFPVKLPEMCLKLHGLAKTKLVLDPFLGIGTTALACLKLGLSCIAFEIDPEYFQIATERLREAAQNMPLLRRSHGCL